MEENRKFAEKFNYNFPLLCDTDKSLGLAYGACESTADGYAKRISYVISPEGRIVQYQLGLLNMPKLRETIREML